jgi:hypothetical protein
MCIDYRKLNKTTNKDHFLLSFIDEMLERLANHSFFCFFDGYSGYHQIPIHQMIKAKPLLHVHMELMLIVECLLDYVMHGLDYVMAYLFSKMHDVYIF